MLAEALPSLQGIHRGVVTRTNDPEGRSRIRARVPSVLGLSESAWALPLVAFTEPGTLPRVGDPVWILFEGGDPGRPIWAGTWLRSVLGTGSGGAGTHPDLAAHDALGLATQAELDAHAATAGHTHPNLAAHDTLGLATQAELDTHAATAGHTHPDLAAHDTLGLATQAELDAHAATAGHTHPNLATHDAMGLATDTELANYLPLAGGTLTGLLALAAAGLRQRSSVTDGNSSASAYPEGTSVQQVSNTNPNWPTLTGGYGTMLTVKWEAAANHQYAFQILYGVNDLEIWSRSRSGFSDAWTTWRRIMTTVGSGRITVASSAPSSPAVGDLWVDTS